MNEGGGGIGQLDLIDRDEVRHVGEAELFIQPGKQLIEERHCGELTSRYLVEAEGIGCEALDVDQGPVRAAVGLTVEIDCSLLEGLPFF